MPRLPELRPEALSPAQEALLQSISASPRGAAMALEGPFGVWMHSPEVGEAAQQLGQQLRYRSSLPPRLSELAILICSHRWRAGYEWYVHAPIARSAGLAEQVIQAIAANQTPVFTAADEAVVYSFAVNLIATSHIPDDVYEQALQLLGEAGVVDLVALLGYYTLVAFTLNAFKVSGPAPWQSERAGDAAR